MTTINPADYLKYLSGSESSTGFSTTGSGSVNTFINSAWVFASEESTVEQKANAGVNVVTELLKLLTSKAESKAKDATEKAKNIKQKH